MRFDRYDVVVVGAGPAGAAAALVAARLGLGPVLLLDKAPLGRPKTCAGGLSPRARRALDELGLWDEVRAEAQPVRGLRLVSRSGREAILAGAETASVLPRSRLDTLVVQAAAREGVELALGTPVDELLLEGGRVAGVRCGERRVGARWVVAANGALSRLAAPGRADVRLLACMGRWEGLPMQPGLVEMFFDAELMPHYAWVFPESATRANVGLCLREDHRPGVSLRVLFDRFRERHLAARLAGARPVGRLVAHPIRASVPVDHVAPPGLLVAGEANRLVNVATGEGISYALESGAMAARAIRAGARGGWDPGRTQSWYRHRLRMRYTVPFRVADLFQRFGVHALDAVTALARS